jgi:hypothetical protein
MHDAFSALTDENHELAIRWMVGSLCSYVSDEKWNEFVTDAVRMFGGRKAAKDEHKPERSRKDASTGPDN